VDRSYTTLGGYKRGGSDVSSGQGSIIANCFLRPPLQRSCPPPSQRFRLEETNCDVTMRRSKRGRKQILPLPSDVRQAVLNYIRMRPRCSFRHLFVTVKPPYRPIGKSSLYCLTSRRLKKLGVISGCLGPHSIRHARVMQLLRDGSRQKAIATR
jgi:integrase